ncbi:MAG: YgjV family protein [Clostridia bacterium]|nr:YgjV family protein [Clostridia bacterium]
MWFDIFVQGIGFVAIAMNIISVQFNRHSIIMLFKSLGSFLFCIQYLLLGAFTGMVMDFVGVIRNFIFANNVKNNKSNKWWIVLFSVITVGAGITTIILTWDKTLESLSRWSSNFNTLSVLAVVFSIISILAKLISTIGYGAKKPHTIRMTNLPTCSLWIVYNFMAMSIAGIINEAMSLCSVIIAEIRFRKKPEKKENELNTTKDTD